MYDLQGMTEDELSGIFERISNWGRWGPDDQRGTLNCITEESVRRGTAASRTGRVISCGLPTPVGQAFPASATHSMLKWGNASVPLGGYTSTDSLCIACHGPMHTHVDALCHMFFNGMMYNGRSAELVSDAGAAANDITAAGTGIVGRGILLDICRLRGVDYVVPEEPVRRSELEQALRDTGASTEPGDILLVRLGRQVRRSRLGIACEKADGATYLPGLHPDALEWLHALDLSLLASDAAHDAIPSPFGGSRIPIHVGCLVFMGLHLLDNADFDELAQCCADQQRWEFMFSVAPLSVAGATGCSVNPLAIV